MRFYGEENRFLTKEQELDWHQTSLQQCWELKDSGKGLQSSRKILFPTLNSLSRQTITYIEGRI